MASAAVSLPHIPTYHDLHPQASPPGPSEQKHDGLSSSRGSLDDQSERRTDFVSETTPHTSFQSDSEGALDDNGLLLHGVNGLATRKSGMTGSETAPGALDRYLNVPVGPSKNSTKLEDFELIRVLGKGCAGRVLLVRHTPTSSIRAMKALSKRSVLTHDELYHTLTELSILRRFAETEPGNPFVSALQCSFTDRENFYFVMDFYPSGDLATQMEIHGILGHHRTRFYAADLVQGLEDLHRHGIIVRDLKPENILLNARGHAVLADFGLSKEFEYRGEALPLHVVTYPGEGDPPEWAGAGMGSARLMKDGSRRLVVDRATSFVGTSEYLSPEVVKRAEYTYAVDWWALGCIVLEGLIGRVPFRTNDDEPLIVLWNRIVSDPWEDVLKDPRIACRPLSDYGLDAVTWHFIDSLLIKDPMWRLTEPYVKRHGYFQLIDWETVQAGEYDDPHELDLHPVQEYNTRYFPKLCLEEEPSVDMRTHDARYMEDTKTKTPLNDNDLYALECARFRKELAGFAWSRGDAVEEEDIDTTEGVESETEEEDVEIPEEEEGTEENAEVDEVDLPIPTISEIEEEPDQMSSVEGEEGAIDSGAMETDEEGMLEGQSPASTSKEIDVAPTAALPSPKSAQVELSRDTTTPTQSPGTTPTAVSPLSHHSAGLHRESPKQPPVPIRPVKNQLRLGLGSGRHSPSTILSRRFSQEVSPGLSTSGSRLSHELRLPSGAPQSGLSVSDIVSIPSPGLGSPKQIIRRHPQLESVDNVPIARLSVEMHGTIAQLGDEDWEELDVDSGAESASNVPPSSFFSRVLKRRPSTLQSSSLARQVKSSSSSSSSSPTKLRGVSAARGPSGNERDSNPGSKGFGSTKKALEKIKAFPKLRKVSGFSSGETSAVQSPSRSEHDRTPTKRDKEALRHNGSPVAKMRSPGLELNGTTGRVPLLALPPQISPLSESFSINQMPRPLEAQASISSLKVDSGSDGKLKSPVDSTTSDGPEPKATRPAGSRRHTESGTGWFDKKPRLRNPSTWGQKMSASMTSTGSRRSGLFRSGSKSRASGKSMVPGGSRSETALNQGEEVPKLELKATPPLDIAWKEA